MSQADEPAALRRWAETWAGAGQALDELQRRELRGLDTPVALAQLADAFDHAL